MGVQTGSDVAFAFALVVGAGLATTLGAAFAFCAKFANKSMLAVSLGLSAGVMIYVSFGEIFMVKAVEAFEEHLCSPELQDGECAEDIPDKALLYATFSFFGGIAVTALLEYVVSWMMHCMAQSKSPAPSGMSGDSVNEIDNAEKGCGQPGKGAKEQRMPESLQSIVDADYHAHHLQKVGLMSGLAIALHNFPEGLATFVAAIAEPASGLAIAVAIALHNIPEGVVVAMPIYYSSGSRLKAFLWAFLSGVSEPIGGIFGWLILSNLGQLTYAIMFAVVAGMMIYISLSELIPTALSFDPENHYVTKSVFVGMAVMAASLLMFTI